MPLASGNNLREQYGYRITGEDGYFDSFELAIFDGYRPRNIETPLYQSPLVVFSLPSPWATYVSRYGTIDLTSQTETTTKAGEARFFRLIGIKSGTPYPLIQGTIGKVGADADISVTTTGWPLGLPVTLDSFTIYPPPASNP